MINVTRAARLVAITAVETIARTLFPDVPPIGFHERALIIAACLKVGQLYPRRNESDETFAQYEQALAELASHTTVSRVLALATFRGIRDPQELTPISDHVDRMGAVLRELLRKVPTYRELDDAHKRQAEYIRSGHLAIMRRANKVSLLGDMGQAVHAIADQRDDALRALESLAETSRTIAEERDQLRAKLASMLGPDEEHVEPERLEPEDLSHVGAELHEKWRQEEEADEGASIVAHDEPYERNSSSEGLAKPN